MSINWGFIGAGMVAEKALTPAVRAAGNANLYAVASRDIKRAIKLYKFFIIKMLKRTFSGGV